MKIYTLNQNIECLEIESRHKITHYYGNPEDGYSADYISRKEAAKLLQAARKQNQYVGFAKAVVQ